MASEAKDFIDTWTGEADLDAFTADEERGIIDAGLASLAKHGPVPPAEARRHIDALLKRLGAG